MSERVQVWPVAIWTGSQWLEADRSKWPRGPSPIYVVTTIEPALGVLAEGRVVLGAEAMAELELERAGGDFGGDDREAWLLVGVPARP